MTIPCRNKSLLPFVWFLFSSVFLSLQMRLPLRSFCIPCFLLSQRRTVNTQRRALTGAAMRLVQFRRHGDGGGVRVGVEQGEGLGVVDLKAFDPSMPSTVRELLEQGDKGLERAQRYQSHSQSLLGWTPSTLTEVLYSSATSCTCTILEYFNFMLFSLH